jgi:predicted PurR-regulated permease PerM
VLRAGVVVLALYFGLQLLWLVHPVLLTGFIGLLFGLGAARGADHLERIHVPRGISAPLLVLASYCALVGILAVAAPTLDKQFGELRRRLPEAMDRVDQWVAANRGSIWGEMFAGSSGGGENEAAAAPLPPATPAEQDRGAGKAGAAGRHHESAHGAPAGGSAGAADGSGAPGANAGGRSAGGGALGGGVAGGGAGSSPGGTVPGGQAAAGGGESGQVAGPAGGKSAGGGSGSAAVSGKIAASGAAASGAQASPLRLRLAHQLGAATQYLFPFLSSTLEVLAGLLLITFVAIFFALDPLTYRRGVLHLVPHSGRERADEVLTAVGLTLRRWLATQFFAMLVIGSLVSISLALLGVEAALSLGIIAGVLEFIPTVGSIMAAIPAIAMGFLVSPQKALAVGIVFTVVQLIEGHVLIPMLMKRGMNLPPLLTILGQAIMAVVFGFLGLLVAVPLIAVVLTTVKMLYVNDVVGDGVRTGAGVT